MQLKLQRILTSLLLLVIPYGNVCLEDEDLGVEFDLNEVSGINAGEFRYCPLPVYLFHFSIDP